MKTNTIDTLEFWEKVKEEYEESVYEDSDWTLCNTCITFPSVWKEKQADIIKLAGLFIIESKIKDFKVSGLLLFDYYGSDYWDREREVRRLFIDWNIERLKK